jgi:hypothetical protein
MRKKTIVYGLSAIVLFSLVAMMIPTSAQVQMADEFGVEDAWGNPNTYVDVPVNITNTTYEIIGIEFNIVYDSTVINLTDIKFGGLTSAGWSKTLGGTPGANKILLDGSTPIGIGQSGSVVLLNFSVQNAPGRSSPMNISDIKLGDTSIPLPIKGTAPAKNGTFNVKGEMDEAPYLVTYTISNRTISPDGDGVQDDTSIDVKFSEPVATTIKIEDSGRNPVKQLYSSSGVTDPSAKVWDGKDGGGSVVPNGDYYVNITMDDGVNPLVYNNTEIITVLVVEEEPVLTEIVVLPASVILNVGDTQQFTAQGYDQRGNPMPGIEFTWESSDAAVGTVNETGFFEALALGSAMVNATNDTIVGSAIVTVSAIKITEFRVTDGPRGSDLGVSVNISNAGTSAEWFIVKVTGVHQTTGYPLVGTGVVRLAAEEEVTIPLLVYVPASADAGSYNLFADVWIYDDYPDLDKAVHVGPQVATVS